VFHSCPHSQHHRSSLRGDQPHKGQRMRGSEGPVLFSSSSSRSKTTDDLEAAFNSVEVLFRRTADPDSCESHRSRTFLVVVRPSIKPTAFQPNSTLTATSNFE
jgi:hypothetical protein